MSRQRQKLAAVRIAAGSADLFARAEPLARRIWPLVEGRLRV